MTRPLRPGPIATPAQRLQNLAAARQWRIDNKPYFDAIYGPERQVESCGACGGTGKVLVDPAGGKVDG